MANKERANFYKGSSLIIDNTNASFVDLLELYLSLQNISFEDFIDLHQHEIYHLHYNTRKCCQCTPGYILPNNRILNYPQLEALFDGYARKPGHRLGNVSDFCCAKPRTGITANDLDLTLIRVLLVKFCNDIFWYSCLTLQSQSLEDFLNQNKHQIYHLLEGNHPCLLCPPNYQYPVTNPVINVQTWNLLFNLHQVPCSLHSNVSCDLVCTDLASPGITVQDLNDNVSKILIEQCCPLFKIIEDLTILRNTIVGHARAAKIPDADYEGYKKKIESGIIEIAKVCKNEDAVMQSLSNLNRRTLDETLCIQYQNMLLEWAQKEDRIERVLTDVLHLIVNRNDPRQFDGNEEINRVTLIEDLASFYEGSNESSSCRFEESLRTSFRWLSKLKYFDPKLSAIVSTVEHIQNIRHDRSIVDLQIQIEAMIDKKLSIKYEGAKQYFIERIVVLSEVDINRISENDISFLNETVQPFQEAEYMAEMSKRIDILKRDTGKRSNFMKLMIFIQCYMLLSILREIMLTMFLRILDRIRNLNIQRAIEKLIKLRSNSDRSLIQFLANPAQDTLIFNFMYDPAEWNLFDDLLNLYLPHQENYSSLDCLCTGTYVIKPVKYDDAYLFMADIACMWLRWSKKKSKQSEFTFEKKTIGRKSYFKIISSKWPKYHATIGNLGIWARGCICTGNEDLFEILGFEHNGEYCFSFSPKDSRGYFLITQNCGNVYGSYCSARADTSFKIVSVQATSSMGNNYVV